MKNQQRQQAQSLYLQSGFTKTQIAEHLSVSRRTVYQWSLEGDWDKLRKSAQHMPAILAEKCYYLIGHFTDHLLSAESMDMAITKQEVDMLHKLTITANKLKQGSTVSDTMQTFTFLLDRIQRQDPALAEAVAPYTQSYVHDRRKVSEASFLLDGFNEAGYIDDKEENLSEHELDKQDLVALRAEMQATNTGNKPMAASEAPLPDKQPLRDQPTPKPSASEPTPAPSSKPSTPQPKPHATQSVQNKFASFRNRTMPPTSSNSHSHSHSHAPAIPIPEAA